MPGDAGHVPIRAATCADALASTAYWSVQGARHRAAGRDHAGVLAADDLEQVDEAHAHPLAVRAERRAQDVDEPAERVLDLAAEDVEVRDRELRVDVRRVGGGRRAGRLQVEVARAVEQSDLRQTGAREGVARVLLERLLVRGGRGRQVVALDRVVGRLVQRRQLRLGLRLGGRRRRRSVRPGR